MPTKEAYQIYEQARELLSTNRKDDRTRRDCAAMLLVALERAGGPFPEADTELALLYMSSTLHDEFESKTHADRALKADPNQFDAQYVKTVWALLSLPGFFASQKFRSEMGRLVSIFNSICRLDQSAERFLGRSGILIDLADNAHKKGIRTPQVFAAISNAPVDHLEYENDEQRAEVQKLRIIAQGRTKI